ncbi:hypothetical protein [Stenotrophomonas maltophilia]
MAAVTAAAVVGAGMAYSANRQGAAQKKAGRAQASAAQDAIDQSTAIYNNSVDQAMPFYNAGTNALGQLEAVNRGDYSGFENSPDYLFALQQGTKALDRSAASRGSLFSGGQLADLQELGQGLATQNLGNYTNRLLGLSQMGQNQSQFLGNLGQNYSGQVANALGIKGQANAQTAAAGPMAQAGYGNALASAASTYLGAGGGAGGLSSFSPNSLWGQSMSASPGSSMGFGNNLSSIFSMPGSGRR